MSCFLEIFHRYLDVMLFSRNMKNHIVFTLILGGRNVDISLVLYMFSEFYVFFTSAFSIDFFEPFNGQNICIGGAPEVKTVELIMKKI